MFDDNLRPLYEHQRKSMLDAYAKQAVDKVSVRTDPAYRELADARRRAAQALVADAAAALPAKRSDWQWEEYANDDGHGTSFLVFVRYDLSAAQLKSLTELYTVARYQMHEPDSFPGVTAFPLLAFGNKAFHGGAYMRIGAPWAKDSVGQLRKALTPAPPPK
jgi:hypothetical protein